MMKIKILNIGGITRELTLSMDKGLTIYRAPNAYGKTSLTKALISLLTSEITPADLLNVFSDRGYIEVEMDGNLYYRRFQRKKNKIEEEKKLIMDDDRALLLSYFSPENQLLAKILTGDENIEWFISKTSKVQEIKSKKEDTERKLQELKSKYEELTKKYREIKEITLELQKINEEIEKLEADKNNIKTTPTKTIIITRQNKIQELKSRIEAKQKELKDNQARLEKLVKEIESLKEKTNPSIKEKLKKDLQDIDKRLQELTSKRNTIEIELGVLNRVLEEVKESEKEHASVCHVCGSKVDPSIWKTRLDIILKEIEENTRKRNEVKSEIDKLTSMKKDIEDKLRDIEKNEKILEDKLNQKDNLEFTVENLKRQIEEYEKQLKTLEEKVSSEITQSYMLESGYNEIDKKLEDLKKKRGELEYQLQMLGASSKILEEISSTQRNIEELTRLVDELQREYIRRLTVIREKFSELASALLRELEFDFTAEIDSNYRLVVKRQGMQLDIKKLSSSERTTLALILVLVALKEYFKSPFFIVDESFMTFDQKRFEKLMKYLNGVVDYVIITKSDEVVQLASALTRATTVTPQVFS